MVKQYIPQRGDLVFVNFNPQTGREQAGKRPAVVISPILYNKKAGLAIMVPITSRVKGFPFEVELPKKLKTKGVVLSDHVKNFDWQSRKVKFLEKLPAETLEEVVKKLNLLTN
ncbi:MAG: endoribonuclease MazF [Candidatus Gracilibacteria bacterium]